MGERFNTSGTSGRDCPICHRAGSLTGERVVGAELKCSGCYARFRFDPTEPFGQLERIVFDNRPPFAPRAEIERRLKEFDGAMPASNACGCGVKLFGVGPLCSACERQSQAEQRETRDLFR